MNNAEIKKAFEAGFGEYTGSTLDIAVDVMRSILSAPSELQAEMFEIACTRFGRTESKKTYKPQQDLISTELRDNYIEKYGKYIDAAFELCLKEALDEKHSESVFYHNVWQNVIQNCKWTSETEKIFAGYFLLIDKRIPYYRISIGGDMDDAHFENVVKACKNQIAQIKFILSMDFEQRSQEAYSILQLLEQEEVQENKLILLVCLIKELRDQRSEVIREIVKQLTI